jgi:hypothetical protein
MVPTLHRVLFARRASPLSGTLRWHAGVGAFAALLSYVHVGCALPALGDSSIVGAGTAAILPALLAAFLLVAHAGLGLRLLSPRLRARVRVRRLHALVAITIVVAVLAHVVALRSQAKGGARGYARAFADCAR